MTEFELAPSKEVDARRAQISGFLESVLDSDELPYFLSDQASLYDVYSGDEEELIGRCIAAYGVHLTPEDFRLPIWKLVDRIYGQS